jgi:tagaturonate reductase
MKQLNRETAGTKIHPVKILQFGEGNFLRAFVDWMIDGANRKGIMSHGIAAVQPIPGGEAIEEIFKRQDCLYHVVLEGIKDKIPVRETTLVESVTEVLNPYRDYARYEEIFLSPELEIVVSNTTEAGIRWEEGDDIRALPPVSFPAKMTALLYKRWQKFGGDASRGLDIVCCELIENNGSTLREYVLRHAQAGGLERAFTGWVETACYFYDTLVDRIVTGFPKDDIAAIRGETGYDDNLVVKGEFFHVWAIGGNPRIREKLPLDRAGYNVLFMPDIRSFRDKKVRILNGAHTAMDAVALQLGCETVGEAFDVAEVEKYVRAMVEHEVLPVIDEDPAELRVFADKILERFYNPYLRHYLKDISLNSISKWEARDWPTVRDNYLKCGRSARLTIFSFGALMVLYSGHAEVGFTPGDNPEAVEFIRSTFDGGDIEGWIDGIVRNRRIWGENFVGTVPDFVAIAAAGARNVLDKGMMAALREILDMS